MAIMDKKALLIINPVAGRKQIQRYVVQIIRSLMDKGYLVTTMVTAGRTDARDWTARFGADFDLVVCAGGDGTLNECASGMADADLSIPLGYIPCGSTNDFAAAHGLSTDIPVEAERIAGGCRKRYDLGCFGERYFLHHALFGAFTWMAYSTDQEQKNVLGYGAYVLDALKNLSKLKPIPLSISADGVETEGEYVFGVVSTNRYIAGIYELPEELAGEADGRLAAVLIQTPKTVLDWDSLAHSLLTGDLQCPLLTILTAQEFWIRPREEMEWSLDGESSGKRTEVRIRAKQAYLSLQG
jgi:YegS/Rv2252/BmrU family lipid kinase